MMYCRSTNEAKTLDTQLNVFETFKPEIIGMGFFSIHYIEVQRLVRFSRQVCEKAGLRTTFIAGGIHASTEPARTLRNLEFDHVFIGEAEISLSKFCDGMDPRAIPGVMTESAQPSEVETRTLGTAKDGTLSFDNKGEVLQNLDSLPFPDYSLVNYQFYANPNRAKFRTFTARSLDVIMGRGCVYRCAFCAYNALGT